MVLHFHFVAQKGLRFLFFFWVLLVLPKGSDCSLENNDGDLLLSKKKLKKFNYCLGFMDEKTRDKFNLFFKFFFFLKSNEACH